MGPGQQIDLLFQRGAMVIGFVNRPRQFNKALAEILFRFAAANIILNIP